MTPYYVDSGRREKTLQEDLSPTTHFPGVTTGLQGPAVHHLECRLPGMQVGWSWGFSPPVWPQLEELGSSFLYPYSYSSC